MLPTNYGRVNNLLDCIIKCGNNKEVFLNAPYDYRIETFRYNEVVGRHSRINQIEDEFSNFLKSKIRDFWKKNKHRPISEYHSIVRMELLPQKKVCRCCCMAYVLFTLVYYIAFFFFQFWRRSYYIIRKEWCWFWDCRDRLLEEIATHNRVFRFCPVHIKCCICFGRFVDNNISFFYAAKMVTCVDCATFVFDRLRYDMPYVQEVSPFKSDFSFPEEYDYSSFEEDNSDDEYSINGGDYNGSSIEALNNYKKSLRCL